MQVRTLAGIPFSSFSCVSDISRALLSPLAATDGHFRGPRDFRHWRALRKFPRVDVESVTVKETDRCCSGRKTLLGISKRGVRYLRTWLVHGARSALRTMERERSTLGVWAARLKLGRGSKAAAVALANENTQLPWALLTKRESYRPAPSSARVPPI